MEGIPLIFASINLQVSSVAGSKETTPASGASGSGDYNENYQAHGGPEATSNIFRGPDIQVNFVNLIFKKPKTNKLVFVIILHDKIKLSTA